MTTFTAILSSTGTTETLSGNTLAMGAAAFRSLWGQTFRGEECPDEVHDVDPSGDSGIPAFLADDVLPRAVTVSTIAAGGTGYALMEGQGVDGCDVWALVTGVTEAAKAPAPAALTAENIRDIIEEGCILTPAGYPVGGSVPCDIRDEMRRAPEDFVGAELWQFPNGAEQGTAVRCTSGRGAMYRGADSTWGDWDGDVFQCDDDDRKRFDANGDEITDEDA